MIQFKRGESANWKNVTTPLSAGQPGYATDTHELSIGDGSTNFDDLPKVYTQERLEKISNKIKTTDNPDYAIANLSDDQYFSAKATVDYINKTLLEGSW